MILKLGSELGKRVELRRLELRTSCMPYTLRPSPGVAACGPAWSSPAASVAACGLSLIHICPSAAAGRARSRLARQSQDRQCARAARASPDRQATHHARTVAAASNASLGRADQAVLYASPRLGRPHASTATGSSHDLTAAYLEHRQDRVLQRTVPAGAAEGTRRRLSGVPYRAPCGNPHRAAVTDLSLIHI